jgi:hypothetical protein
MAPPAEDNPSYANIIKSYYANYKDVSQYITDPPSKTSAVEQDVKDLQVTDTETSLEEEFIKDFLYIGGPEVLLSQRKEQPEKKEDKQDAGSSS